MRTHAARGPLDGGPAPLCKTYAMGDALTDDLPTVDCPRCRALLMEPGPIVPAPTIRRRPPAEVAAYFDGAVAALRYVKAHGADGIRVVDVDSLIALFESSRAGVEP